jgi:FKBP-type peptidyl-prolyl cis-trans isomerase
MKQLAFVVLASLAPLALASCNNDVAGLGPPSDPATETFAPSTGVVIANMTKMPNGVYYQDLSVGTGATLTDKSDTAWVTYAGRLKDGTLFDSGTNSKFELPGGAIVGFRTGIQGMKVGGHRKLVIPSELAYDGQVIKDPQTGKIIIPRQSTLVFDVDLLNVHTPTP